MVDGPCRRLRFSATHPAHSAERKSIRWATSSTGSYGYKVAAQMTKVLEDALGGEYTVTVNPYPSTTAAMKATMDGTGEIGYTADVGMTQVYESEGGFKELHCCKIQDRPHLVCLPDGVVHGRVRPEGGPIQILGRFQRQAGILHPRRLHELAQFPAHLQGARLPVQTRPDRRAGRRATRFRPAPSSAPSPIRPPARRSPPTGARPSCASTSR